MSATTGICKTNLSWPAAAALCVPVVGDLLYVSLCRATTAAGRAVAKQITQLRNQRFPLENRVNKLNSRLDTLNEELDDLAADPSADLVPLSNEIAQISAEIQPLNQQLQDYNREIDTSKNTRDNHVQKMRLMSKLGLVRAFVGVALIVTLAVAHVLSWWLALAFGALSLATFGWNALFLCATHQPYPRHGLANALQAI